MRGTILHPTPVVATFTGIFFSGLVVFAVGLTVILAFHAGGGGQTLLMDVPLKTESVLPSTQGGVFLLDEAQGKIVRVGSFDTRSAPATVSLRLPAQYQGRITEDALLWHGQYSTALPYVSFIGDEEMQARWMDLGRETWSDPEMYRQLTLLLTELPRVWWESEARFSPDQLLASLARDPETRKRLEEMYAVLEPRLLEGVHHVLWNQAASLEGTGSRTPNVKLIWAARRLLFGAQEPAITLFATRSGVGGPDTPSSIRVKEVF